jgi:DNA topoisomerase-1
MDRRYVVKEGKQLRPVSRGRVVTSFLSRYFARYVDYGFSADMEAQLDEVSDGQVPNPNP